MRRTKMKPARGYSSSREGYLVCPQDGNEMVYLSSTAELDRYGCPQCGFERFFKREKSRNKHETDV